MPEPDTPPPSPNPTRWVFDLSVVSPLFLGGARPNDQAELRIPAIRGALRNWYRLLVGPETAAATKRSKDLSLAESRLFGGTAEGEGQGRLVLGHERPPPTGTEPWKARTGSGRAWLGYSHNLGHNRRRAIPAGTEFGIRSFHPRGLSKQEARLYYGSWWLFLNLGGLGSRSRRGFGSLAPTRWPPRTTDLRGARIDPPLDLPDPSRADTFSDYIKALAEGLWTITDLVPEIPADTRPAERTKPLYFLSKRCRFVAWWGDHRRGWRDPGQAFDALGEAMIEYRQPQLDGITDPSTMTRLLAGQRLPHAPLRTTFGLPLAYRDKKSRKSVTLVPHVPGGGRDRQGRMPSPLLCHLAPITGDRLGWVLTLLDGAFPGRDLPVARDDRSSGFFENVPETKVLERFLDKLPRRKEATL